MRFIYPVELEEVRRGLRGYCVLATFPDLPEANTFGKDRADALASAVDCLEVALAAGSRIGQIFRTVAGARPADGGAREPDRGEGGAVSRDAGGGHAAGRARPAHERRSAVDQPAARSAARQPARPVRQGLRPARQARGAVARKRRLNGKAQPAAARGSDVMQKARARRYPGLTPRNSRTFVQASLPSCATITLRPTGACRVWIGRCWARVAKS